MKAIRILGIAVFLLGSCARPPASKTQTTGIQRTELQRHDLGIPGREAIQVLVALDPGVAFPRHSHPGEELIYVLEGSLEYQVGDEPAVTLSAGEILFIPDGAIHAARNVGHGRGVELATYIVAKGEPLVVLAD